MRRGRAALRAGALLVAGVLVGGALVAGVLVIAAVPAGAHLAAPGVRNVIDRVAPSTTQVSVSIRATAADELVMTSRAGGTVLVLDPAGVPFLRFTRSGVDGNTNSVGWYASESIAFNPVTSVPGVTPASGPRWLHVSDAPVWAWFDPRLRPDQPADAAALSANQFVRLAAWTVPVTIDGAAYGIHGHREFAPIQGTYQQQMVRSVAGVSISVVGGAGTASPAVYLQNDSGKTVTVLGAGGEPMLRIAPDAVDANTASPSWLLQGLACCGPPTGLVSATAAPRWTRVANRGAYSWLEERGSAPGVLPPPGQGAAGHPVAVRTWSLPLLVGSQRETARARIFWQPLRPSTSPAPSGAIFGGVAGAVVGLLVLGAVGAALRRRRGRMSPDAEVKGAS